MPVTVAAAALFLTQLHAALLPPMDFVITRLAGGLKVGRPEVVSVALAM